MPKILLNHVSKFVISCLFVLYLAVAIIGASQIKIGLKLQTIVPESSYLARHFESEAMYFRNSGPPVMFVVTDPLDYFDGDNQLMLRGVMNQALKSEFIDPESKISWLDHFTWYLSNHSIHVKDHTDFVWKLHGLVEDNPQYENDIAFNEDYSAILASRFYVTALHFNDSTMEGDMMVYMRDITANSTIPMMAYSPQFVYYEHYKAILKNTLLAVGVAIIGMLFIALAFIPHPISISCITITMITIALGMMGFMHFWGLPLSAITTVQIILSIGFSVDFTVHISHAFMAATGKNRNERVTVALEKVGVPIMNGAISSVLGILMLAFASSYVFISFFKTMLLVILLGLAHALLFLPVVLSFIGPKRTNKPKVFVPVSVSCRSAIANPPHQNFSPKLSPRDGASSHSTTDEKEDIKSLGGYRVADLVDTPEERHGLLGLGLLTVDDKGGASFKDTLDYQGARPRTTISHTPGRLEEYELDAIKFNPEGSVGSVNGRDKVMASNRVGLEEGSYKTGGCRVGPPHMQGGEGTIGGLGIKR